MRAKVVQVDRYANPVDVTSDGTYGTRLDFFRRFVAGTTTTELTLDTGEVIPWEGTPPEFVRLSNGGWRRDRRLTEAS